MVSTTASVAAAAVIVCGGAAVAAAAAASSSNVDVGDPLMMRVSALALRTASAAATVASSSSSFTASSYYFQGGEIAEVARVVVSGRLAEEGEEEKIFTLVLSIELMAQRHRRTRFFFPLLASDLTLNFQEKTISHLSTVGAGAALGVSAYVLALASAPLLVSLPREGSGSVRVAAARCATAVVASAGRASSSMIAF
jgi:hypothetical protein